LSCFAAPAYAGMQHERRPSGISSESLRHQQRPPFYADGLSHIYGGSSSSAANVGGDEGSSSLPFSAEETLRREIQQCQRSLIRAQAETLAADGHAQEAEESHQQELAVFCVQLDALDRHLQSEHQQQSEEGTVARTLLQSACEQMAEMQEELRAAQSEAEHIEAESRLGRPQIHLLSAELERHLRSERALEAEVDGIRRAADKLRLDLNARHLERDRLTEHGRFLDEALVRTKYQIENYEHWSEGIHAELRLAGSELREDQVMDERERMRLEARAAELESALLDHEATVQETRSAHLNAHQDPHVDSDPMLQRSLDALTLPEQCENGTSYAQVRCEGYMHPVAPPLVSNAQPPIVSVSTWPPPFSPPFPELQVVNVRSQGLPLTFATPPRTVTPLLAPVGSPGVAVFGAQAFRGADTRETARASPTPSALTSSPTVLWCRKVPSQASLQVSPSVPTLV